MTKPLLSAALTIDQLRVMVHLGEHAAERKESQAIELSIRFYFKDLPSACGDDDGQFLCYDKISRKLEALAQAKEYRLIEFLAMQLHNALREEIAAVFGEAKARDIYVWLRLHKCQTLLESMKGGAGFEFTDLPSGLLC